MWEVIDRTGGSPARKVALTGALGRYSHGCRTQTIVTEEIPVPIEVTEEAVGVLRRSLELGGIDPAGGSGVRLRAAHGLGGGLDIQVELADGPLEGETTVEASDVRLFVDPGVIEAIPNAVVTVDPQHDTIVVRPAD